MHGGEALEGRAAGPGLRWTSGLGQRWINLLPFAAAAVLAVILLVTQRRWVPMGDEAAMLMRSKDVFSAHPPLFGVYSTRGFVHPGPAPFVITQVASGFGLWAGRGTFAGMMVMNGVLGSLAVWVTGRFGPPAFHRAVALMTLGALAALGGRNLASFWNPYSAVMWFVLALVCAVSLSFRRSQAALLAAIALCLSVAAQAHVAFAALGVLVAAFSGVWVWFDTSGVGWRPRLRTFLPAAILALLLWAPPVLAQLRGERNFGRLIEYFTGGRTDPGLGTAAAVRLAALVGCPVCDLATARYRASLGGVTGHPWPLFVATLAGLVALGWTVRRQRVERRAVALAVALLAVSPFLAKGLYGLIFEYLLTWLIPVWFAVWLAVTLVVLRRPLARPALGSVLVMVAAGATLISAAPQVEVPHQQYAPAVAAASTQLLTATRDQAVTVDYWDDPMGVALPGVIYQLLNHHPDARTADSGDALKWGWREVPSHMGRSAGAPRTEVLLAVRYRDDDWSDLNRCVVESGREIVRVNSLSAAESTRLYGLKIRRLDRSWPMSQHEIDKLEGLAARAVEIVAVEPKGPVKCPVVTPDASPH